MVSAGKEGGASPISQRTESEQDRATHLQDEPLLVCVLVVHDRPPGVNVHAELGDSFLQFFV